MPGYLTLPRLFEPKDGTGIGPASALDTGSGEPTVRDSGQASVT